MSDNMKRRAEILAVAEAGGKELRPEHKRELEAYRKAGILKSGLSDTTEAENKAGAFLTRALGANESYEAQKIGARSLIGQQVADNAPNFLNVLPGFIGNSPERQVADSAQDEFIAASLRQDSGAAIPPEEMERQRRIYFPMPGDGPEVIEQKRQARLRAIEGLKTSSGPLADKAAENSAKVTDISKVTGAGGAVPIRASNTALVMADQAPREIVAQLPPEKEAEIIKLAPYLTPETMVKWFKDNGYDIPPEQAQKAYEYYQSGGKEVVGVDYSKAEEEARAAAKVRLESDGRPLSMQAGDRAVDDVFSLGLADEARGIGRTFSGGTLSDNIRDVRAEDDVLSDEHPYITAGGQLAAGVAFPFGTGARTPGALAKVGGITGALYGAGSGRTIEDRVIGAATGGSAGTALGYGGGKILQKLGSRTPPSGPAGPGRETMEAAERIGVDLLPADVGGPFTRGMTGAARQGIVSELPIAKQVEKTLGQAQGVRDAAATGAGDAFQAGRAIQRGAEGTIEKTKTVAGKLYDAIPIGPDQKAALSNTRQTLTDLNNKITSNPELAAMLRNKTFEGYQRALSDKGLSWNDLKAFRTEIGHKLDGLILKEDTTKADLDRLYASLSADMEATARAQGPAAVAKFERANRYYRARQDHIKTVLLPVLGKDGEKGAQAAYNQIQNWAKQKGESARVAQLFRSLPKDEADTVSATVISELGTPPAGQGGTFSLAKFATDWNKLDGRAKAALFRPEVRSALNDLATVAEGAKATAKYSNTSNTGRAVAGQAIIAAVAGGALDFGTLLAGSAAQYMTGAMLASPRVARWMAKGYGLKGPALKAHIAKLPKLAAGNPAIASDVAAFERSLLEAANDNFTRSAAASDQEEK